MNEIVNHITMKENTAHVIKLREEIKNIPNVNRKLLVVAYIIIALQGFICGELSWFIAKH